MSEEDEPLFSNVNNKEDSIGDDVVSNTYGNVNEEKINYIHIRQLVESNVWKAFAIIVKLNNSTLKIELTNALREWIDKKYNKCSKCKKDLDNNDYLIIIKNGKKILYCEKCKIDE